jgi:optic atrophy protein 1
MFNILDPRLKQLSEDKMSEWRKWFDNRLDNAIEAANYESKVDTNGSTFLPSYGTSSRFKND